MKISCQIINYTPFVIQLSAYMWWLYVAHVDQIIQELSKVLRGGGLTGVPTDLLKIKHNRMEWSLFFQHTAI